MPGAAYFLPLVSDNALYKRVIEKPSEVISSEVLEVFKEADISFGNLECAISDDLINPSHGLPYRMIGPENTIRVLEDCGFDVINIANNHILDHGFDDVEDTISKLRQNGIRVIGTPLATESPVSLECKGLKIGFMGFNLCPEGPAVDLDKLLDWCNSLQSTHDISVVSLHWGWGYEHMLKPSHEQVQLGRRLVDEGVDVVLGHHSHTFQPVEKYKGGVIAYSLGNFLFDMWREENLVSGILQIDIRKSSDNIDITVEGIPIRLSENQVQTIDHERIERSVSSSEPITMDEQQYREVLRRTKSRHRKDVISQYLMNFHKFPLGFHAETIKRWSGKALLEV